MKNSIILSLAMIIVMGVMVGCTYSNKEFVKKVGLEKSYNLLRTKNANGINGEMEGKFFLGCGSIDGKLSSERQLQFEWGRNSNERIITTLPYSKFIFVIDSTKIVPTIEFVFGEQYLREFSLDSTSYNENPNSYLYDKGFQQAVVKISRKDYEEEVYLQN